MQRHNQALKMVVCRFDPDKPLVTQLAEYDTDIACEYCQDERNGCFGCNCVWFRFSSILEDESLDPLGRRIRMFNRTVERMVAPDTTLSCRGLSDL